nr:PREDICTED: small proline-rich protein 2E-like [Struthio camelus australis]
MSSHQQKQQQHIPPQCQEKSLPKCVEQCQPPKGQAKCPVKSIPQQQQEQCPKQK